MKFAFALRWIWGIFAIAACLQATAGERAEVIGPITGGAHGVPFSAPTVDIAARGYVTEEFFLDGKASAYRMIDGVERSRDGHWRTERTLASVPYRTRILVVRPANPNDFNGTVIVHWQNVTAGFELGSVGDGEYLRSYAWVGVSAQAVGINGFPGPNAAGLRQWDAERYASLNHPGDAYSYDIFTQAGRAVGPGRGNPANDPMGGLVVQRLVAAGASQSAAYLRTYINGVHPLDNVFDGFIPYIDFGSTAAFQPARVAYRSAERRRERRPARVREDLSVPVLVVNSETETQAYLPVRQPDSVRFRFWEVAGSSHVTVSRTRAVAREGLESANWLAWAPVFDAAIRHMHVWLADGTLPPVMPRIATTTGEAGRQTIMRDELGNAVGGIRLPDFAVPTAEHRGMGAFGAGNRLGFLYGYARDFTDDELAALYPSRSAFLSKYDAALSRIVTSGAVLAQDAPLLRERAAQWAMRLPSGHE